MLEKHISHLVLERSLIERRIGSVYNVSSRAPHRAESAQIFFFFDFANFCERLQITFHLAGYWDRAYSRLQYLKNTTAAD